MKDGGRNRKESRKRQNHKERGAGKRKTQDSKVAGNGNKNEGDQPPDLALKDGRAEEKQGGGKGSTGIIVNEANGHITDGNVKH